MLARDRVAGVLEERVRPDEPRRLLDELRLDNARLEDVRLDKGDLPELAVRLVELVRLLIRDDEVFALLFDDGVLAVALVVDFVFVLAVDFERDARAVLELAPRAVVESVPRVRIWDPSPDRELVLGCEVSFLVRELIVFRDFARVAVAEDRVPAEGVFADDALFPGDWERMTTSSFNIVFARPVRGSGNFGPTVGRCLMLS